MDGCSSSKRSWVRAVFEASWVHWRMLFQSNHSSSITHQFLSMYFFIFIFLSVSYHVGDLVNVTCYSRGSSPPAELAWKVNDDKVNFIEHTQGWPFQLGYTFRFMMRGVRYREKSTARSMTNTSTSITIRHSTHWCSNQR